MSPPAQCVHLSLLLRWRCKLALELAHNYLRFRGPGCRCLYLRNHFLITARRSSISAAVFRQHLIAMCFRWQRHPPRFVNLLASDLDVPFGSRERIFFACMPCLITLAVQEALCAKATGFCFRAICLVNTLTSDSTDQKRERKLDSATTSKKGV